MTVYEQRHTVSVVAGAATAIGLNIPGGLIRQVIVRALTSQATVFRVNLTDDSGLRIRDYGYHTGEVNDPGMNQSLSLAVAGSLAINITNASPTDTFAIKLSVQE